MSSSLIVVGHSLSVCRIFTRDMRMLSPVRLSHGWIIQKRLKLGLRNFHHTVAPSSGFSRASFIQKVWGVPPERAH